MRYFYEDKDTGKVAEIDKETARRWLDGNWKEEYLDDIFDNDRMFRLYTAFSTIWTQTDNGLVPMAGFIGVVG